LDQGSPLGVLSQLTADSLGVFRGRDAVEVGVTRKQLAGLRAAGVIERDFPDTYRITVVKRSSEQSLIAALLWAGEQAVAAGLSAGELYSLEGVHAPLPEMVVPRPAHPRAANVLVGRYDDRAALMVREVRGIRVTGIECTLLQLAATLESEAFEIACEDARRRRLTSVRALQAYLKRFGRPGRPGVRAVRQLLAQLDPKYPSRSTLEVKTRRLLVANGSPSSFANFRSSGTAGGTCSTSPLSATRQSSRPTDAAGTMTPLTTSMTTTSGAFPVITAIASCSRLGTR